MGLNLGFMASGRGSNIASILRFIERGELNANPRIIVTNNYRAPALELGRKNDIPSYYVPYSENSDQRILRLMQDHNVNMILLAGYLKKLRPELIANYANRILNIHPALLPKYGGKGMYGMRVHEAVIQAGETESGATIHLVDEKYDHGKILAQYKVPVYKRDTPESLAERVLRVEHILYPQILIDIEKERIII